VAPKPVLQRVPPQLSYGSQNMRLDREALSAFQRLVDRARKDGIRSPYLKLKSGYRDYDRQAGLWRSRLLPKFAKLGCSNAQLPCIANAIDRTSTALKSVPIPHGRNTWVDRFVSELAKAGCSMSCNPRSAVSALRKGTAPPGRSPHHTGRAVDLHVGGRLSTAAANVKAQRNQDAYKWLVRNAVNFGFYPYNREPWHWEYNPPSQDGELFG